MARNVDVFWIPPEIESYIPVTDENIEEMAFKIVHIKNEKQAGEVMNLIHKSDRVVDRKRIRVKVSTDGRSYYFDSNGIGASSVGKNVDIDLRKLKAVLCE